MWPFKSSHGHSPGLYTLLIINMSLFLLLPLTERKKLLIKCVLKQLKVLSWRSFKKYVRWGEKEGGSLKNEQKGTGKRVLACVYVWGPVFPIDHNEDRFFCTLLLCATFRPFLCTVHYFLCALSAKIATYSLVTSDAYFVINSYLY